MADIIRKTFDVEVKGVNVETGEVDIFIPMSTESWDRDGEVILPSAWKKRIGTYRQRPVLVSSHDYQELRKQIGEVKIKLSDKGIEAKPKYYINSGNPEADWGFFLAKQGMAAYSVGFIPFAWEDGDGEKTPKRTYTDNELLEISHVIVPSNRDAAQNLRSILKAKGINLDPDFDKALEEVITKPEETENYIHIRVKDPGDFQQDSFKVIDIDKDKGIKATIGRLKGETTTTIQKYMFDKDKGWTMESAQAWVREHEKNESPEAVSQTQIADELDYVRAIISKGDIDEKNKTLAWDIVRELLRLPGSEIPVDIMEQMAAKVPQPPVEEIKPAYESSEIAVMVVKAVEDYMGKLRGAVN